MRKTFRCLSKAAFRRKVREAVVDSGLHSLSRCSPLAINYLINMWFCASVAVVGDKENCVRRLGGSGGSLISGKQSESVEDCFDTFSDTDNLS